MPSEVTLLEPTALDYFRAFVYQIEKLREAENSYVNAYNNPLASTEEKHQKRRVMKMEQLRTDEALVKIKPYLK